MSYTFAKAAGKRIGNSICEDDKLQVALDLQEQAEKENVKLYLPVDILAGDSFSNDCNVKYCSEIDIPDGWEGMDAGDKTIELFGKVILESSTILWNGPIGVFEFETFAKGTNSIAEFVAKATEKGAFAAVGGGGSHPGDGDSPPAPEHPDKTVPTSRPRWPRSHWSQRRWRC